MKPKNRAKVKRQSANRGSKVNNPYRPLDWTYTVETQELLDGITIDGLVLTPRVQEYLTSIGIKFTAVVANAADIQRRMKERRERLERREHNLTQPKQPKQIGDEWSELD